MMVYVRGRYFVLDVLSKEIDSFIFPAQEFYHWEDFADQFAFADDAGHFVGFDAQVLEVFGDGSIHSDEGFLELGSDFEEHHADQLREASRLEVD